VNNIQEDWLLPAVERRAVLERRGFTCSCPACQGRGVIVHRTAERWINNQEKKSTKRCLT